MDRQPGVLTSATVIGIVAVVCALLIASSILHVYWLIFQGIVSLILAFSSLAIGIRWIQAAKRRDASIPWWKQWNIIAALGCGCWGMMLLIMKLVPNQANNIAKNDAIAILVLFAFGSGIYESFLILRLLIKNVLSNRSRAGNQS